MKRRYVFVILLVLTFGGLWFLPWWGAWCIGFLVVLVLPLSRLQSFISGFMAGFISWLSVIVYADFFNDHILSKKLAVLFNIPSFVLLILANALVGGLLVASGAWLASSIRNFSDTAKTVDELENDI